LHVEIILNYYTLLTSQEEVVTAQSGVDGVNLTIGVPQYMVISLTVPVGTISGWYVGDLQVFTVDWSANVWGGDVFMIGVGTSDYIVGKSLDIGLFPASSSDPVDPSYTSSISFSPVATHSPSASLSLGVTPSSTPSASLTFGASPSGTPSASLSVGASPSNLPENDATGAASLMMNWVHFL